MSSLASWGRHKNEIGTSKLDGYSIEPLNMGEHKGRGMIMYVHNDFNLHNFEFDFQEAQFGCLKLGKGQKILIGSMYRSPTSTNVNNENLNVLLDIIMQQEPTNVLLTGDFNFPASNWEKGTNGTDHEETAYRFLEKLRDCYMNQLVTDPIRGR